MKIVLIVGTWLLASLLCWAIVAGSDRNDDEKAHSGLLEDDE